MIPLLADEHIPVSLIRAIESRCSDTEIVRVQDVGLRTKDDGTVLEWAAKNGRALLTADVSTIPAQAYCRVKNHLTMPGVLVIVPGAEISELVEHLFVVLSCGVPADFDNQVIYLPL